MEAVRSMADGRWPLVGLNVVGSVVEKNKAFKNICSDSL